MDAESTPEPFGDPAFFYARYNRQQYGPGYRYPPDAYSVMAWWDYGYWIEDLARRIPVTNPAQMNAEVAADFFLSQSEKEATSLLETWRTRYVVVDERLLLWSPTGRLYARRLFGHSSNTRMTHRRDEYFMMAYEPNAEGKPEPKVFYLPAYYRSLDGPAICIRRASRGWTRRGDDSVPPAEGLCARGDLSGGRGNQAIRVRTGGLGGGTGLPQRRMCLGRRRSDGQLRSVGRIAAIPAGVRFDDFGNMVWKRCPQSCSGL